MGAVVAVCLLVGQAQACAVCGHGPGSPDPMGRGYYWGILFMMAMPFSIVGAVGGWLAYLHWRVRSRPRRRSLRERARDAVRIPCGAMTWIRKETER